MKPGSVLTTVPDFKEGFILLRISHRELAEGPYGLISDLTSVKKYGLNMLGAQVLSNTSKKLLTS